MKKISMSLLAVLTLVSGLLVLVSAVVDMEAATLWTATKVLVSVTLITFSMISLLFHRISTPARRMEPIMFATSLLLIAMGSGGMVWNYHLGIVTGDFEYMFFLIGTIILAQGVLSSFTLRSLL